MPTLSDIIELAQVCAHNARITVSREVAGTLWRMAIEYQQKAADLDGGKLPNIGDRPKFLK